MAELSCPLCGSVVKAPRAETQTRYYCKKCHTTFHLNKALQPTVGEPPSVEEELEQIKQKLKDVRKKIPAGRIVAGLTALVVVGVALYYLFGPAQRLGGPAEEAAQALADKDLDHLRSIAVPGTAEDVARWFDEVQPRLAQVREGWFGRDEVVEVHVKEEDPSPRQAVGVSIHPANLGSRDVTLADPAAATASAAAPFDVVMVWSLDKWGRWKLDGRETYALIHPTP